MQQLLLITKTDFDEYVDISSNLADSRINPHITNAQKFDVCPFLGESLFYDFLDKIRAYRDAVALDPEYVVTPEQQKYLDLLSGKSYQVKGVDILFEGVKPALVFYSQARILANNNFHTTANNIAKKLNEYSQTAEEKEVIRLKTNAESVAYGYMDDVRKFLNNNLEIYPLWRQSCNCELRGIKKSGARISAI